jgi:hypothetical protein
MSGLMQTPEYAKYIDPSKWNENLSAIEKNQLLCSWAANALASNPNDSSMLVALGVLNFHSYKKNHKDSIEYFKKAVSLK